jgi:alpha-tubulin suppressor-like RCC1 family protein
MTGPGGSGTLSSVRWVDGGSEHTCAITLGDTVYCWGRNDRGQVGDGTTTGPRLSPRQVVSTSGSGALSSVTSVAAGLEHACAYRRDDTNGYCWGRHNGAPLGDGTTTDSPVPVATDEP